MKYKALNDQGKLIDDLIDSYKKSKGAASVTPNEIRTIVTGAFPTMVPESDGWHKTVFRVQSEDCELVLKIGRKETIENDHRVYKRLPKSVRHRFLARIFWHTKYCLLQEYGSKAEVSPTELKELRNLGYHYGLMDIKNENIRSINGQLKIIDANIVPQRFSLLWRIGETIKFGLPKRVNAIRKKLFSKH